eukprot:scaffold10429_cov122-Isochrysis_galbana.AAC.6
MLNTNVLLPLLSEPICTFCTFCTVAVSAVRAWRWKFSSGSRWMVRVALFMCAARRPRSLSSCAILSKSALFSVTVNESSSPGSRCLSCLLTQAYMAGSASAPLSPLSPMSRALSRPLRPVSIAPPSTVPSPRAAGAFDVLEGLFGPGIEVEDYRGGIDWIRVTFCWKVFFVGVDIFDNRRAVVCVFLYFLNARRFFILFDWGFIFFYDA